MAEEETINLTVGCERNEIEGVRGFVNDTDTMLREFSLALLDAHTISLLSVAGFDVCFVLEQTTDENVNQRSRSSNYAVGAVDDLRQWRAPSHKSQKSANQQKPCCFLLLIATYD